MPPGSRNKPKVPAVGVAEARGTLCLVVPARRKENRAAPRASTTLILWGLAPSGAMAALSPWWHQCRPPSHREHRSGAQEGIGRPGPPSAGCGSRVATRGGALHDQSGRDPRRLAAVALGPLVALGSHFLEFLVDV
jgi:hypothetical protein